MSSPISSLKKSRKSPFPTGVGQRHVPFRHPEYTGDESKLLDEITSNMATSRLKHREPNAAGSMPKLGQPTTSSTAVTGPSDYDLMGSMMNRVTQLEKQVTYSSKQVIEKDRRIKVLEEKVQLLQKHRGGNDYDRLKEYENKCIMLQKQIQGMENFLADYGMVWVGDESSDTYYEDDLEDLPDADLWRPDASVPEGASQFKVDYDTILENIKDLNVLAGDGTAKIQHTVDGARLKMTDPVQLILYANGMLMFNGPFRPFSDPETQQCLQDFMDGYFPSELQTQYPDGIPFSVTDKRDVHFEGRLIPDAFSGSGQVLGGDIKPSRLVPSNLDKYTMASEEDNLPENRVQNILHENTTPGKKLSVEQFLNNLPSTVVRDGKVIDIRSSISDTIQGGTHKPTEVTVVQTEAVQEMKDRIESSKGPRSAKSLRDVTTLRIKSETGDHTYILKMKFDETIADVRTYLDKERAKGSPAYNIMSAFPNQVYSNNSATLWECGLTPNATLHLRPLK